MAVYCPDADDLIWLDFLQPVAKDQAGRRPALVLSPHAFNVADRALHRLPHYAA